MDETATDRALRQIEYDNSFWRSTSYIMICNEDAYEDLRELGYKLKEMSNGLTEVYKFQNT